MASAEEQAGLLSGQVSHFLLAMTKYSTESNLRKERLIFISQRTQSIVEERAPQKQEALVTLCLRSENTVDKK